MPWCNNDVAVHTWHIPDRFCSNERRWVCDLVRPRVLTYFNTSAQPIPWIPLPVYMLCIVSRHRTLEIGFTTMSLVYGAGSLLTLIWKEAPTLTTLTIPDLLAFSVIVYLVVQSNVRRVQVPRLLRTIAQGATHYFLIIFTSHLVLELTLLLARVRVFSMLRLHPMAC